MSNKATLITSATGGTGGQGTLLKQAMDQDINMAKVNMITPTKLMKLFLLEIAARRQDQILNVSSSTAPIPGPLQAEYYATKADLTSLSNALWYELKDTGVTVTALMPDVMDTDFAKTGGLTDTKMGASGGSPVKVAWEDYQAMVDGKLSLFAGLVQRPFVGMMPLLPRKIVMRFVADQQSSQEG